MSEEGKHSLPKLQRKETMENAILKINNQTIQKVKLDYRKREELIDQIWNHVFIAGELGGNAEEKYQEYRQLINELLRI